MTACTNHPGPSSIAPIKELAAPGRHGTYWALARLGRECLTDLDAYYNLDARAGWRPRELLELSLRIENVFNRHYFEQPVFARAQWQRWPHEAR